MARPFFEESIIQPGRMGTDYGEGYSVAEHETVSGDSYAHLRHPYPVFRSTLDFANIDRDDFREDITALFHKCQGSFAGFRYRHDQDFSTNNYTGVPTALDQLCVLTATANVYQIVRWYGTPGDPTQSHRRIRKPQVGSALVSVAGQVVTADFTVSYTTGLITFADNTKAVTAAVAGATTVLTVGDNSYQVGDRVHVSGVIGTMSVINGGRYLVTARDFNSVTIAVSTAGLVRDSGGVLHTSPQTGEQVAAGCYFDIPVHFISELSGSYNNAGVVSGSMVVEELLNP